MATHISDRQILVLVAAWSLGGAQALGIAAVVLLAIDFFGDLP